jgi:hypothetical protein
LHRCPTGAASFKSLYLKCPQDTIERLLQTGHFRYSPKTCED